MLTPEQYVPTLTTEEVASVLTEAARRSFPDKNVSHPVDIATAMAYAVEYTAEALVILRDHGHLKWAGPLGAAQ